MKKYLLSLVSFILLAVPSWGQMPSPSKEFCPVPPVDSTLVKGEAARDNLWPGFGTGSRRQSDMESASLYRAVDILGFALTGVGVVGVAATALQRGLGVTSLFSGNSSTPYFIFGGIAAAGVATVTVSRIKAVRHAREYDLILFPAAVPGGAGAGLALQF